jgi:hypothetical protein
MHRRRSDAGVTPFGRTALSELCPRASSGDAPPQNSERCLQHTIKEISEMVATTCYRWSVPVASKFCRPMIRGFDRAQHLHGRLKRRDADQRPPVIQSVPCCAAGSLTAGRWFGTLSRWRRLGGSTVNPYRRLRSWQQTMLPCGRDCDMRYLTTLLCVELVSMLHAS